MPIPPFVGKKKLYICFAGYLSGCCIRSIPLETLFNNPHRYYSPPSSSSSSSSSDDPEKEHDSKRKRTGEEDKDHHHHHHHQKTPPPPDLEEVWSDHDNQLPRSMGCGRMGSKILLVGGIHRDFYDKQLQRNQGLGPLEQKVSLFSSNDRFSKRVFVYDPAESTSIDAVAVPDMISPKSRTMVVSVGESLYVLAGFGSLNRPDPTFEVYTSSTKTWDPLDCPRFLTPNISKTYFSYAVIGSFIYVSSVRDSFRFDTKNRIWEPSTLFDGTFLGCSILRPSWVYEDRPLINPNDVLYFLKEGDADYYGCPPLGFYGQGVLFGDDILICRIQYQLVTYLMVEDGRGKGGKVVRRSQSLRDQGLIIPVHVQSSCIADCGNGFFCLVVTEYDSENHAPTYVITIKPFHLTKKKKPRRGGGLDLEMGEHGQEEEDDEEEFLLCEVANEFNYTYNYGGPKTDTIWHPIGCSVH